MAQNAEIISQFFEAYCKHDREAIEKVMDPNVQWFFPGHNPFSGIKTGIDQVITFFDKMSVAMSDSSFKMENLVTGENEDYLAECQHVQINRKDGLTLNHYWTVLWKFSNGKIIEGRHLASDQHHADSFLTKVL